MTHVMAYKATHNYVYKNHGDGTISVVCNPCKIESPLFRVDTEDALLKEWCNQHHGMGDVRGRLFDAVMIEESKR